MGGDDMTKFETIDESLQVLRSRADTWIDLPLSSRIKYLEEVLDGTRAVAERQVTKATEAKSISKEESVAAEEYFGGPVVQLRTIRQLLETLRRIQKTGSVTFPNNLRDTGMGRLAAAVFPTRAMDKILFGGFEAEIWLNPEVTRANLKDNIGYMYREKPKTGLVSLVLGAGNVASIGPLDVIHKLFVEGQVCILKMNPVNEYLGPFFEESFNRLIQDGFVQIAYGGAEVGKYLCEHPEVDEIHITGSDKTHDAIVFGVGAEGAERKKSNQPQNKKRITSELGNVSPIIVVPGSWTRSEMRYQAENVATQMTNNGGFNCNAAKMLITWNEWAQKRDFLDMLASVLAEVPQRVAYYPGAFQRYDHFVSKHSAPIKVGVRDQKRLPWTLLPEVRVEDADMPYFTEESFCGVTAQTSLQADSPADFLERAVDFCNERVWGTLNACILIDPRTEKNVGKLLDEAIAKLRYGSVGVNQWPALCYGFGSTSWGAFPGHTLDDIQSGIGVVHNTYLLENIEKSVMRGPFSSFPKPPWFVTHTNAHKVARKMVDLEYSPSYWKLPGVAFQAMRG